MKSLHGLLVAGLLSLILCFSPAAAQASSQASSQAGSQTGSRADAPTLGAIESRITELRAAQDIDETTKTAAIELLGSASEQIKKANESGKKASEFRQLTNDAPQQLAKIRDELSQPPSTTGVEVPAGATLAQLEQLHTQASAALQGARQNLADLQDETTRRDEQRTKLTERLSKARQELADLRNTGTPGVSPETPIEIAQARTTLYQSNIAALESEIDSINAELESYNARRELLPARRDRAQRRASEAQALVEAWQNSIVNQRQLEAERTVQEANKLRREAARQHPVLKQYADESVKLANTLVGTPTTDGTSENYAQQLERARTELNDLNTRFTSIRNRLNASGLNRATGLLLRHQYESIPELSELRKAVDSTQRMLDNLDYTLIELQERRIDAGDVDQIAQSLIAQMADQPAASSDLAPAVDTRPELLQVARELAAARRDLLDKLIRDASNNFADLVDLNSVLRETSEVAGSYRAFIEERILWVRSIDSGRGPRINEIDHTVRWLIDPSVWTRAWSLTVEYFEARWVRGSAWGLVLVLFFLLSVRCCAWIRELGERVARYTTDSFRFTVYAALLTALMAAPIALLMCSLGWLLRAPEGQHEIIRAMGTGLFAAAFFLYPLAFFRHLLRPGGLGIAHFKWSKDSARLIRKNLRWFIPTIVPLVLFVTAIDSAGDEAANASLGRVLFTLELFILTIFLHRVLRPQGAVLARYIEHNAGGWIYRLRYIWYLLAVTLPMVFAILSWLGFHYTALQLQTRLEQSLILTLVLVVSNEILHRWLYVARRRVAVEDAKRRRAQAESDAETKQASTGESSDLPSVSIDEEKIDLPALSEQTKQIFHTSIVVSAVLGLFLIWAQALPALRMFDRVQVWPSVRVIQLDSAGEGSVYTQTTSNATSTPDGSGGSSNGQGTNGQGSNGQSSKDIKPTLPVMAPSSGESPKPEIESDELVSITLADIGFSLIVLIATWIAFRNIPGLIEIVVLQRLPLDAGSRYALSTVLRYLIAIAGILVAFKAVGISWSNVQWLAAALTFGLAFGLQEIFANFVSGLIILAERPIRLGDTVTVGGVSGTVMRIRMRATTISDWDRKELVIPNKTFITGEVINWSLTDPVLRIKIEVGVSYSSDIDKVERLLLKIAKRNATVLADPEPRVLFKDFGDSTLNFELRVFIPHIDFYVPVRNEINRDIFKSFGKEGIEIAFPQRDLHVRSIGDLSKLIASSEETGQGSELSSKASPVVDAEKTKKK
tara:strand:+ start:35969 stop:39694 length:3726 start_codon:yes stop_codon:yes gene_type:complete